MLYYRPRRGGWDISRRTARLVSLAALTLYPAGALVVRLATSQGVEAAGFLLIIASLVCVAAMATSSLQRIVGEQASKLDEYELRLRARAVAAAYTCFSAMVLIAIIYCAIGSDRGAWLPSSYDEFNGLFWGAFIYSSMLPSAFLAWQIDEAEASSSEEGGK